MTISDKEFGEIKIKRPALSKGFKISVGIDGVLTISAPHQLDEAKISQIINQNRTQIRKILNEHSSKTSYKNGDLIGKSHVLIFRKSASPLTEILPKIKFESNQIIIIGENFESQSAQTEIRKAVKKALQKQAKRYLSRRVEFIAEKFGFSYKKLRFSHAKTRWGSCSSSGTISLNIALMNLPHKLIDYVIIHELCHTRQMNHSKFFWAEVEKYDPNYKLHDKELKKYSPQI